MKTCSKCRVDLPLTEFCKDKHGPRGYRSNCRACKAAADADYRVAHREEVAAHKAAYYVDHREEKADYNAAWFAAHTEELAARQVQRRHSLAPTERAEMLEQQCGLCACGCGTPATCVDHCHDCEDIDRRASVRGLLCHPCNVYLDHIARFSPTHAAYLAVHAAVCPAREVAA